MLKVSLNPSQSIATSRADCFVEGCQVSDMLFQKGKRAVLDTAYVILTSAVDVAKAVAKRGQLIGEEPVRGKIVLSFSLRVLSFSNYVQTMTAHSRVIFLRWRSFLAISSIKLLFGIIE